MREGSYCPIRQDWNRSCVVGGDALVPLSVFDRPLLELLSPSRRSPDPYRRRGDNRTARREAALSPPCFRDERRSISNLEMIYRGNHMTGRLLADSEVPPAAKEGRSRLQSGLWQVVHERVYEFTP